jgi:ribosomal peptide maturation radical SAM protein 1
MPFSALHYPSIGLSLLQPALRRIGVTCDIRYFFLDFADLVGVDAYDQLVDPRYYQALVGEWVFAGEATATDDPEAALHYLHQVFGADYPALNSAERLATFLNARAAASQFIPQCVDELDDGYDLVGFTTSFQQNTASLAAARLLKQRSPQTRIAFGGANCQGDMGLALIEHYDFIDAVCLDEGDTTFPTYVEWLRDSGASGDPIPGMAVRVNGVIRVCGNGGVRVEHLDDLPDPDFDDFFHQHGQSSAAATHPPAVLVETARGCWWGAKHHCTFCGINGLSMAFRSKSQGRAYDEITRLAVRYGSDFISVDAILDQRYFKELLPRLAAEGPAITMYCELKSNLTEEQLILLSRAGLKKIQPGIEALDTPLLKLMKKGCTTLQNVQTLKLAAEAGLYVEWNLLHGFPGEEAENYRQAARVMAMLFHLQPPNAVGPVRADRFSPYFNDPERFGIVLEPLPAYRFLYPFDKATVRRLAYHFLIRLAEPAVAAPAVAQAAAWQLHHDASALTVEDHGPNLSVADERWGWPRRQHQLTGAAAAVYRCCAVITSRRAIMASLGPRFSEADVDAALERLDWLGLVLHEGQNWLALALRQPGFIRSPSWEQIREAQVVPYLLRGQAPPPIR